MKEKDFLLSRIEQCVLNSSITNAYLDAEKKDIINSMQILRKVKAVIKVQTLLRQKYLTYYQNRSYSAPSEVLDKLINQIYGE